MDVLTSDYPTKSSLRKDRCFAGNALLLLVDSVVSSEEFFESSFEKMRPERLLLRVLLLDAVQCYLPRLHPRYDILPASVKKLTQETVDWFSGGNVGLFPFDFVCDHLGKAPDRIRKKLEMLLEKTNAYKALFSFGCKTFSQEDVKSAILAYQKIIPENSDQQIYDLHRQLFCYVLRSVTKPTKSYLEIGRFFGYANPYAVKMHKEFFLSYVEGHLRFLKIADDFSVYFNEYMEGRTA